MGSGVLVIQDFQTEMNKFKPGDVIQSKHFKVKDNLFAIRVYPNGSCEAKVGIVGLYVGNFSDKEVNVSTYTISDGERTHIREEHFF